MLLVAAGNPKQIRSVRDFMHFPEVFDIIYLGGDQTDPAAHPQNRIAAIHVGLVGNGGQWGARLAEFLSSRATADI